MRPDLVTIRFKTARATLTSVHYAGVDYDVERAFAHEMVHQERVADFVTPQASESAPALTGKKKR